jgi:hypothetical protein
MFGEDILGLNSNIVLKCNDNQFPNDSLNPIRFGSDRVNDLDYGLFVHVEKNAFVCQFRWQKSDNHVNLEKF